jgi:hypothetical protein
MLEDALRDAFANQATSGPADGGQSMADRAIARAVTHRRRRHAGSVIAGVLALVITGIVSFTVVDGRGGPPSRPLAGGPVWPTILATSMSPWAVDPSRDPEPLEVVSNGEIYTEGSKTAHLALPAHTNGAAVRSAYHADDGYLVVTAQPDDSNQQLLLLDKAGDSKVLLSAASTIAVSDDGAKVAWRYGNLMSVADRKPSTSTLDAPLTVQAPDRGVPVAFIGPDVVLGRTAQSGTGMDAFDLWDPDQQATYTQSWDPGVVRIFGALADGSALFAQVRDAHDATKVCMARLVPDQPFKETDRACVLPQPAAQGGGVAPDGRYLVYPAADGTHVVIVDLEQVFNGTPVPRVVDLGVKFDPATVRLVWLGPRTAVVDTGGSFVTIDPTQPTKVEPAQANNGGKVLVQPLNP